MSEHHLNGSNLALFIMLRKNFQQDIFYRNDSVPNKYYPANLTENCTVYTVFCCTLGKKCEGVISDKIQTMNFEIEIPMCHHSFKSH